MNTLVKSSSGIQQISVDSMLLSRRKIFIEGEINPESACEFVKALMVLNAEDTNKYIDCFINSPGGEMNSGLLIYDAIQSSRAPVRLFVLAGLIVWELFYLPAADMDGIFCLMEN